MNWGWFFLWVVSILLLFFVTGWPVSPSLAGSWGNQFDAKSLTYYGVLYFHYLTGGLFFSFLGLGLLRDVIWTGGKGGNRQLTFLLAYSVLIASGAAVFLAHRYCPAEDDDGSGDSGRHLGGPSTEDVATDVAGMEMAATGGEKA
jgi:hypothetical protein